MSRELPCHRCRLLGAARRLPRLVDLQQATICAAAGGRSVIGPGGLPVVHMQTEGGPGAADAGYPVAGYANLLFRCAERPEFADSGRRQRHLLARRGSPNRKVAVLQAIQAEWKKMGRTPAQIDLRVAERPYVR